MIFSMKKPKDALDGFSKGAGNFFKGVAGGAALLVAAPIQGALEGKKDGGGSWGAFKGGMIGLGKGIAGGTALALGK